MEDADRLFDDLVERHRRDVGLYLVQSVGDRALAEDLLQDTFAAAYRDRARLREVENGRAWLYGIARNRALDANRRRRRYRSALDSLRLVRRTAAADPSEAAAVRDLLARHLDEDERALLILRYLHGFDSSELARVFATTPEAIRQRLSRARRRLCEAAAPKPADLGACGPRVHRAAVVGADELDEDEAVERLLAPLALLG
jgi:RNA polymerase sigma-70 factor, ECF subfamily